MMFALVGLGNEAVCQSLPVNRAKMLSYAGMLASPAARRGGSRSGGALFRSGEVK